jgi:hypothetical protein
MKHVGKMKNNGAKLAVVFRTLPGEATSALVCGTNALPDAFHDSLMSLIESESGQQANELADVLAVRRFPDGSNMLEFLHRNGLLTKVATNMVTMVFDNKNQIALSELNQLVADQKGITIDQLSITESTEQKPAVPVAKESVKTKWDRAREDKIKENEIVVDSTPVELSPTEMRSRADALFKEAARLRKEADTIDPPKKKTSKVETTEA